MLTQKGISRILIILGVLGIAVVCTWDIITGKAVNDITGPKSIAGFAISVIFIIIGLINLRKSK